MPAFLTIPWFQAEAWEIPLPFEVFGSDTLPIQPFGLLVAIGVLLGAKVAELFAKRHGLSPALVADMVAHCVISGFVISIVLNTVFYHPERVGQLFEGGELSCNWLGLSSYGGFIGAVCGLFLWKWRRKLPVLPFADAVIYALPFGWLFGRMGCFVVHDHPGVPTDFFLAIEEYRFGNPPYEARHDLGLYEVIWAACAIGVLVLMARKPRPRGFYLGFIPLIYAPVRFGLDFLRANPEEGGDARYFGLTPAHYSSVALFIVGLGVMWRVLKGPPVAVPKIGQWPPPVDEDQDEDQPETERNDEEKKSRRPERKTVGDRPSTKRKKKKASGQGG